MEDLLAMASDLLDTLFEAKWWQNEYFGNTLQGYALTLVAFLGFIVIFKIIQVVAIKKLQKIAKKTQTQADDILIAAIRTLRPPFYSFLAFYFAIKFLAIQETVGKTIEIVLVVWVVYQVILALQTVIKRIIELRITKHTEDEGRDPGADSMLRFMGGLLSGVLWILGVLLILSNFGVNITSLIAGLGIGGIAIALALQNILGDLFSSFAIYFDKPFIIGDFIVIGEHKGTVEKIGIKTTRMRSPFGEEISIPNRELTAARIQNYKKMNERRVLFTFGVEYSTSEEKLERIPEMIKSIIEPIEKTRFDRAHFVEFADSALNYEVSYYINSNDYQVYRDIHQAVLFEINKRFAHEKIAMAYPTQTIHLKKE